MMMPLPDTTNNPEDITLADGRVHLMRGASEERLKDLGDASVDAVVTDPPYGLSREPDIREVLTHWLAGDDYKHGGSGFMGKTWDSFVPGPALWSEVYRVLKPGGHLLCFCGTRTADLMTIAIRMGGFEIRDVIDWLYGTGFPKSRDISKAIDQEAGVDRPVLGHVQGGGRLKGTGTTHGNDYGGGWWGVKVTKAQTPEAQKWQGWGTALKPAHEPIIVARKPLDGTVAGNVVKFGTGAINIAAGTIGQGAVKTAAKAGGSDSFAAGANGFAGTPEAIHLGRWPANLLLTHHPDCVQRGTERVKTGSGPTVSSPTALGQSGVDGAKWNAHNNKPVPHPGHAAADGTEEVILWDCVPGCPARLLEEGQDAQSLFFAQLNYGPWDDIADPAYYVAKVGGAERNRGLGGLPIRQTRGGGGQNNTQDDVCGKFGSIKAPARNDHPTVKPVRLLRYLARLITPPGGRILDPFCGSGSTGCAAVLEGFSFTGVELDLGDDGTEAGYLAIEAGRILSALEHPEQWQANAVRAISGTSVHRARPKKRPQLPEGWQALSFLEAFDNE